MATVDQTRTRAGDGGSPLDRVAEHAQRVSNMCDLLEALADDLPRRSEPVWREASRMCEDVISSHYDDVVHVLIPVLLHRAKGERDCETFLLRLQADFRHEYCRMSELNALLLDAVGDGRQKIGPEALGYALRGFFDTLRRNTSWEMDVMLPLAVRRLTEADLTEIDRALSLRKLDRVN